MTHTIDSLCARIIILENRILSLRKYTSCSKETPVNKDFTNAFKHHIASHFIYKMKCKPTPQLIHSEIKTLWNQLSKEEQSHWKTYTS
jgi:hypothetical protein